MGVSRSPVAVTNTVSRNREKAAAILRKLYVTDNANNDVALFRYGTWASLGTITSGIVSPIGAWVDRNGNFYAVNQGSTNNIVEYDPSGNQIFTYSSGINVPAGVTTDKNGNVYEADETGGVDGAGAVNEYAQGSNIVTATCSLPYGHYATAVAVRGRRVFVSFFDFLSSTEAGGIVVYPRGLGKHPYACTSAQLPVSLIEPIGLAFDRQGDLLVCDAAYYRRAVDVIAPPYDYITGTLGSGWSFPYSVTVDRAGTQVYVTDPGLGDVTVFTWPGGSVVTTLGSADGLGQPVDAVDSHNYVP